MGIPTSEEKDVTLMPRVMIDGVEYVPKETFMGKETRHHLAKAYAIAYGFGVYDPDTRPTHLREVWEHLTVANQELRFKD